MSICIYHSNCTDGLTAAAIVHKAFEGNIEFYAANYGNPAPDVAGKDVYIVDFSYKRPVLLELLKQANKLVILDHHKTAQEDLYDISDPKAQIIFDMNRSGAGITWDYFFPNTPRPMIVNHVEDRDLWRFALDGSKEIHKVLSILPNDVKEWIKIFDWNVQQTIEKGRAFDEFFTAKVMELKDLQFKAEIGGYIIPVCNAPHYYASELAGFMAEGQPFAGVFSTNGEEEFWSLRSRNDAGIDVSSIAKQYGGGGHKNAAGFKVKRGTIAFPRKEVA